MSKEQYFTVAHRLPVNVIPQPTGFELPDIEQLEAEIPDPFRISTSIAAIDINKSRLVRSYGEEVQELIEIINQQSRKIDMIMGYVLAQQDDPAHRFHSLQFGGGSWSTRPPRL